MKGRSRSKNGNGGLGGVKLCLKYGSMQGRDRCSGYGKRTVLWRGVVRGCWVKRGQAVRINVPTTGSRMMGREG